MVFYYQIHFLMVVKMKYNQFKKNLKVLKNIKKLIKDLKNLK